MKRNRLLPIAVVALAVLSLGSKGCPTFPKVEDRIVELALGASTSQEFVGAGAGGTYDDTELYDVSQLDLAGILSDAGVDVSDIKDVKFAGASYRITKAQAGQAISNGLLEVKRGGDVAYSTLGSNFSADVSSVTGWNKVPLTAAGVTKINDVLADLLTRVKNGVTTPDPTLVVSAHVHGDVNPPADFKYEIRLDLTIVGTVKVQVLN